MNRVILVVRFGLAFAAFCGLGELRAAEKPNIVLIVADDLRPDAVAALGNTAIRTPALDRLIRDGTTFRPRDVCLSDLRRRAGRVAHRVHGVWPGSLPERQAERPAAATAGYSPRPAIALGTSANGTRPARP